MKKLFQNYKLLLVLLILIASLGVFFVSHRANKYKVLDRPAFSALLSDISERTEQGFINQEELSSFITGWADKNDLYYKVDKAGNIIFDTAAIERKKDVPPTVIVTGLNYKASANKAALIASAAMIAASDLDSGRKIVIFANDEGCSGKGYSALSKKYVSEKNKVIYMDYGKKAYLSSHSFGESISEISMPVKKEQAEYDTEIKIHISGINSGEITPEASDNQPDPLNAIGALLSRLKSKSTDYRIKDIKLGSNGNMYPVSADASIFINSYSVENITKFIDKQIKDWNREYLKDNPDLTFAYEISENEKDTPVECYDGSSGDLLTRLLYTVNSNAYTFTSSDPIPEGRKAGDFSGVNCITDLSDTGSSIKLRLVSQGYNDMFLSRIVIDNQAGAEILGCTFTETERLDSFDNNGDSLLNDFQTIYGDVHRSSDKSAMVEESDSIFTPCSFLMRKNSKTDIIHIRISDRSAANLTNTIMYYIKSGGNTFSL